jgi:hypothetical protein
MKMTALSSLTFAWLVAHTPDWDLIRGLSSLVFSQGLNRKGGYSSRIKVA